jgi:hypothetical protein
VDAERPERVLVLADLAEVLAVPVDVENVAELAGADQLLQANDSRVVEQEVARHQYASVLLRTRDELLDLAAGQRWRLLDEHVLARFERALRELRVRHDRRRDNDRLQRVVGEHLVEVGRKARLRIARSEPLPLFVRKVAEPGELGELVEVPREVRAPIAEAREADFRHGRRLASTSAIRSEA